MNRFLPLAALALLPAAWSLARVPEPAPLAPDRDIASLIPERCSVFVEGSGLVPLLERGLADPFVQAVLAGELGGALQAELEHTPAEYLELANRWLGRPVLPAFAALAQRGLALGAEPANKKAVLVAHGRDAASVRELVGQVFDRVELSLGWPGALDQPNKHWHGGDVWTLGDELVIARREALFVLGNDADLVRDVLALAADPTGRGLFARPEFEALHVRKTGIPALWGWADLAGLEASGDQGFRELRAANHAPAFLSLLGARLASLVSSRALSAEVTLAADALVLGAHGYEAEHAQALVPGTRPGAVAAALPAAGDLAQAVLYRDFASLFTRRTELFPAEALPGFAEAITNGALFFEGQDLGEEVLSRVSPWLRLVARDLTYAEGRAPEIPLPGLAVVAVLDQERDGEQWITAFQTLISILNVDQAQKGRQGLRLQLVREGEVEISTARFPAPGQGGVDVRYNLEPALAVVGRQLVLGTHASLVREVVRELAGQEPLEVSAQRESLFLDGRSLAELVARNEATLVAQKMVEDGLSHSAAEKEIGGLRLVLQAFESTELELSAEDPRSPELRLRLALRASDEGAR